MVPSSEITGIPPKSRHLQIKNVNIATINLQFKYDHHNNFFLVIGI